MKLLLRLFLIYSWVNLVLLQGLPRVANYYFPGATRPWPNHQRSLPTNLDNTVNKSLAKTYTAGVIIYGGKLYKSLLSQIDFHASAERKVLRLKNEFTYLEHTTPDNVRKFFHSKVKALIQLFKNAIHAPSSHKILPILVRLVLEILVSLFQLFSKNVLVLSKTRYNDEYNTLDSDNDEFLPKSLYDNSNTQDTIMRTRALYENPRNENGGFSTRALKTHQSVEKARTKVVEKNIKNQKEHKPRTRLQKPPKGPEIKFRAYEARRYLPL